MTEASNCPHCESQNLTSYFACGPQRTFECSDCGGFFNFPGKDTNSAYDAEYFVRNYQRRRHSQLEHSLAYVDVVRSIVRGGSLLDYGCGAGLFMRAAADRGFTFIVGADVSSAGLAIARKNCPEAAMWVELPREPLPASKFDVIAMLDSLSHIPNARSILERLRDEHLADGGVFLIRTPAIPKYYFALVRSLSFIIGARSVSSLLFARSRYMLFDAENLNRFLQRLNLKVIWQGDVQDYKFPLPLGSPSALIKEVIRRGLGRSIRTRMVVAKRAS